MIEGWTLQFESCRERMRRLAYQLLGTVADADDIVQEAYLKWHEINGREVRSAEAWLSTVVTRLCIDRLRARRRERDLYFGSWLPEPLYVEEPISPDHRLDITADLSMALLIVLERLTPDERATYLLHDIFDYKYCDISRAIILPKLIQTLENDDQGLLVSVLKEDATITSDGGGRVKAAVNVRPGECWVPSSSRSTSAFRLEYSPPPTAQHRNHRSASEGSVSN
jgi:RNA polymerase sigma-70 factor, ECF subfamily